jgi:hypothetical protein
MEDLKYLIGKWTLVAHSQVNEELDGQLVYREDKTMSVHITGKFNGVEVLISYSGTYYFEEGCVVHKVEISDNPKRIGTEQRRYIKLAGDLMIFTESPLETSFKIVWQKQVSLSSSL